MIEDNVYCSEADASCATAELKNLGFTVILEELSNPDKQRISEISQFKNVAKLKISNGPWGTLLRTTGKIKIKKGYNFYNL